MKKRGSICHFVDLWISGIFICPDV